MSEEITREYISHAVPTKISATSRVSIKIMDSYYTVETSEERAIIDGENADMERELHALYDEINKITDEQAYEIGTLVKKKK